MKAFLLENIAIPYQVDGPGALQAKLSNLLGHEVQSEDFSVWRRSLDVRAKRNIHWNYSVLFLRGQGIPGVRAIDVERPEIPTLDTPAGTPPPVVIGFGPSGIFAAYYLAKAGLCPIVFERGGSVEERFRKVEAFWDGGELDPECNVQFGEGGAGTFSDGKLTSRSKDPASRWVREVLVEHGALPLIHYEAKAHVGTDKLREIIPRIRKTIEQLGGKIFFNTRVDGIERSGDRVVAVRLRDGSCVAASEVVLAIGHSARDTFGRLLDTEILLEPKPFAVGVRVEHRQEFINDRTYGSEADLEKLPPAEYVLTHKVVDRGVYSFCMCPGGEIVDASSEPGALVVNGMSYARRASPWANSALVVSVAVSDFFQNSPLDGVSWQRCIEQTARQFARRDGVPASDLHSFLAGKKPQKLPSSSCRQNLVPAELSPLFPPFVSRSVAAALPNFERTLPGFAGVNPLVIAPETRTSSPVRIVRNPETMMSVTCGGLYPVGEGAGYAGGIISAAIDGWKAAAQIVSTKRRIL